MNRSSVAILGTSFLILKLVRKLEDGGSVSLDVRMQRERLSRWLRELECSRLDDEMRLLCTDAGESRLPSRCQPGVVGLFNLGGVELGVAY
jgi:hypothetical protein